MENVPIIVYEMGYISQILEMPSGYFLDVTLGKTSERYKTLFRKEARIFMQ